MPSQHLLSHRYGYTVSEGGFERLPTPAHSALAGTASGMSRAHLPTCRAVPTARRELPMALGSCCLQAGSAASAQGRGQQGAGTRSARGHAGNRPF